MPSILQYRAFADIGKNRFEGWVIKENVHTVTMRFEPPERVLKVLPHAKPFIIQRNKMKHNVSRIM